MCEYCGCRQVEPIAELMDEHLRLLDLAGDLRRALVAGDTVHGAAVRAQLVELLARHTRREEAGLFTALRAQGDYVEQVDELEGEHDTLDAAAASLDLGDAGALDALDRLVADLGEHIDKEDLGIFPVAVVTLGASGWELVDRARRELPADAGDVAGQPASGTSA